MEKRAEIGMGVKEVSRGYSLRNSTEGVSDGENRSGKKFGDSGRKQKGNSVVSSDL